MYLTAGVSPEDLKETDRDKYSEHMPNFPRYLCTLAWKALRKGKFSILISAVILQPSSMFTILESASLILWADFLLYTPVDIVDIIPLHSSCPMTTVRNGRRYMATVAKGEDICLQGDNSDVQLHITAGCPKRAHMMEIRTDLSSFASVKIGDKLLIPGDECFIAPVVDVLAPAKTNSSAYVLRIPHCLHEGAEFRKVKVRMWHENRNSSHATVEVPQRDKCTDGILFYDIKNSFIELHTSAFCKVICTFCHTPPLCLEMATNFFFGKFKSYVEDGTTQQEVQIRPYFCSMPHEVIADFRQVMEQLLRI